MINTAGIIKELGFPNLEKLPDEKIGDFCELFVTKNGKKKAIAVIRRQRIYRKGLPVGIKLKLEKIDKYICEKE